GSVIPLSLGALAGLTGGWLDQVADPAAVVAGPVIIDSRAAEPGALFAALPGARADGHDFAAQAVAAGAVAVLASRRSWCPTSPPPWPGWPGPWWTPGPACRSPGSPGPRARRPRRTWPCS